MPNSTRWSSWTAVTPPTSRPDTSGSGPRCRTSRCWAAAVAPIIVTSPPLPTPGRQRVRPERLRFCADGPASQRNWSRNPGLIPLRSSDRRPSASRRPTRITPPHRGRRVRRPLRAGRGARRSRRATPRCARAHPMRQSRLSSATRLPAAWMNSDVTDAVITVRKPMPLSMMRDGHDAADRIRRRDVAVADRGDGLQREPERFADVREFLGVEDPDDEGADHHHGDRDTDDRDDRIAERRRVLEKTLEGSTGAWHPVMFAARARPNKHPVTHGV